MVFLPIFVDGGSPFLFLFCLLLSRVAPGALGENEGDNPPRHGRAGVGAGATEEAEGGEAHRYAQGRSGRGRGFARGMCRFLVGGRRRVVVRGGMCFMC